MEILTHLRFTMNLKVRCEQAQQWIRSIRTYAYHLWLVITTLLEIILVWNQVVASWRKTTFYVFSFLEQTTSAVHGFCLQAPAPLFLVPLTSDESILLGMFWFCLNLSENLPSELTSKTPLERDRRARIVICLRYSPIYHAEPFFLIACVALDNITTLLISPSPLLKVF